MNMLLLSYADAECSLHTVPKFDILEVTASTVQESSFHALQTSAFCPLCSLQWVDLVPATGSITGKGTNLQVLHPSILGLPLRLLGINQA